VRRRKQAYRRAPAVRRGSSPLECRRDRSRQRESDPVREVLATDSAVTTGTADPSKRLHVTGSGGRRWRRLQPPVADLIDGLLPQLRVVRQPRERRALDGWLWLVHGRFRVLSAANALRSYRSHADRAVPLRRRPGPVLGAYPFAEFGRTAAQGWVCQRPATALR